LNIILRSLKQNYSEYTPNKQKPRLIFIVQLGQRENFHEKTFIEIATIKHNY